MSLAISLSGPAAANASIKGGTDMRLSALGLLLLVACSDEPTSPQDREPFEWYQLASVDGAALPLLEADGSALHGGILELEGPYYHLTISWETPSGVGVDSIFAGPYETSDSTLLLKNVRDGEDIEFSIPMEGVVQGAIWPGRVMEFWKSWP